MTEQKLIERIAYELWANKISPKPSLKDWRTLMWAEKKEEQKELRTLAQYLLVLIKKALPELAKEAGYVQLAEDQNPPEIEDIDDFGGVNQLRYEAKSKNQWFIDGQAFGFDKAYQEGWRKVKLEKKGLDYYGAY